MIVTFTDPQVLALREAILTNSNDRAADLLEAWGKNPELPLLFYGYQGLFYLLQEQEDEAQGIWFAALLEMGDRAEEATLELAQILGDAANYKTETGEYLTAWIIRQYLAEIFPDFFNNWFALLELDDRLGFDDSLEEHGQALLLSIEESQQLNCIPLSLAHSLVIFRSYGALGNLVKTYFHSSNYLEYLWHIAQKNHHSLLIFREGVREYLDRSLEDPDTRQDVANFFASTITSDTNDDLFYLSSLIQFNHKQGQYDRAIVLSDRFLAIAQKNGSLEDQVAGNYYLMQSLLQSGVHFQRVQDLELSYWEYIDRLFLQDTITPSHIPNFPCLPTFLGYLRDDPQVNNHHKQRVMTVFLQQIQRQLNPLPLATLTQGDDQVKYSKVLKIGYLSECLRRHSIGYLIRDLFRYHDRSQFEIHAYTFRDTNDLIQQEIKANGQEIQILEKSNPSKIAAIIQQDNIDILVDLDSITSSLICQVLTLKPAPIQVTWLGYDASELATVDYFLTDNYIVPEQAQTYYQEKLWRMPHTYVSVKGFEVGTPSLRREDLGIPKDAIVYFSAQTGYKRNPDNILAQLQILKQVPNSYFLIKGIYCNYHDLAAFFNQLLIAEGLDYDRLRFVDSVPNEATHRANLNLVDIVLDTYPYNGATTTLEALWMGIPIVTQVGQQFSARTGYSALMNLGISVGLAWNRDDYVAWGVRLGQDEALRRWVRVRLQEARDQAPLWNSQQFTHDLEQTYRQMWQRFLG